ncbi:MAG: hypothetical protein LH474_00205 [Chamaesiphon sp.]|nr:hypothetical protein [Chamaesiphon sp.]
MFEFDDDAKDAAVEFAKTMAMQLAKYAGRSCGTVIGAGVLAMLLPTLGVPAASAATITGFIVTMKDIADDCNS